MAQDASGKGLLLKADLIADAFRDEVKASLTRSPKIPTLAGILGTSAGPSKFYAEFTRKQCDALGVRFVLKVVGSAESAERADGEGVEEAIIEANEDAEVEGIMVRACCAWMSRIYLWGFRCITRSTADGRYVCDLNQKRRGVTDDR